MFGQLESAWQCPPGRHDLLNQPDCLGAAGTDTNACLHQPQSVTLAHDAREALRSTISKRHAPAPVQSTELSIFRRDAKVAPACQLHSHGKSVSVDGSDGRFCSITSREAHRPCLVDVRM